MYIDPFLIQLQHFSISASWPFTFYSKESPPFSLSYLSIYYWFRIMNAYFLEMIYNSLLSLIIWGHKLLYIWPVGGFFKLAQSLSLWDAPWLFWAHLNFLGITSCCSLILYPSCPNLEVLFPLSGRCMLLENKMWGGGYTHCCWGVVPSRPGCYLELCIYIYIHTSNYTYVTIH